MDFQKRSSANWPSANPSASRETRGGGFIEDIMNSMLN